MSNPITSALAIFSTCIWEPQRSPSDLNHGGLVARILIPKERGYKVNILNDFLLLKMCGLSQP